MVTGLLLSASASTLAIISLTASLSACVVITGSTTASTIGIGFLPTLADFLVLGTSTSLVAVIYGCAGVVETGASVFTVTVACPSVPMLMFNDKFRVNVCKLICCSL